MFHDSTVEELSEYDFTIIKCRTTFLTLVWSIALIRGVKLPSGIARRVAKV